MAQTGNRTMSYTVKTADIIEAITKLEAVTGKTYRVQRNTDWGTFDLQEKQGRTYITVMDWSDKADIISHIEGMVNDASRKQAEANVIKTLENNLQAMEKAVEDTCSMFDHIVCHGGVQGLYITGFDDNGGVTVGGILNARAFTRAEAKYCAETIRNGNNDKGTVMLYREALQKDIAEQRENLEVIKHMFSMKWGK